MDGDDKTLGRKRDIISATIGSIIIICIVLLGSELSGMWYNIYECLRKRRLDVRLSNPAKTRAIASAKIKTDKLDSIKLTDLLRGEYIAECYVPTKETMDLRELDIGLL